MSTSMCYSAPPVGSDQQVKRSSNIWLIAYIPLPTACGHAIGKHVHKELAAGLIGLAPSCGTSASVEGSHGHQPCTSLDKQAKTGCKTSLNRKLLEDGRKQRGVRWQVLHRLSRIQARIVVKECLSPLMVILALQKRTRLLRLLDPS